MKQSAWATLVAIIFWIPAVGVFATPSLRLDKSAADPLLVIESSGVPRDASVSSVKGKAEFAQPGKTQFSKLKAGQKLPVGSTLRTGQDGEVILVPLPGTLLKVAAGSELVLKDLDFAKKDGEVTKRKALIDLKEGGVTAALEKLDPQTTDFKIKMPQGVAAARGTVFNVNIANGRAIVTVVNGNVSITPVSGGSITLGAGEAGSMGSEGSTKIPADPNVLKETAFDGASVGSAKSTPDTPATKTYRFTSNPVTNVLVTIDGVEYRVMFGPGAREGDYVIVLQPTEAQTVDVRGSKIPLITISITANASAVITINGDTGRVVVENPNRGPARISVNGRASAPSQVVGIDGSGNVILLTAGNVQNFLSEPSANGEIPTPSLVNIVAGSGNTLSADFLINLNPEASTPFLPGQ